MIEHYRIEQGPNNWEPIPEGEFESETAAIAAMEELEKTLGWRNLRVVMTDEDAGVIVGTAIIATGEPGDDGK